MIIEIQHIVIVAYWSTEVNAAFIAVISTRVVIIEDGTSLVSYTGSVSRTYIQTICTVGHVYLTSCSVIRITYDFIIVHWAIIGSAFGIGTVTNYLVGGDIVSSVVDG